MTTASFVSSRGFLGPCLLSAAAGGAPWGGGKGRSTPLFGAAAVAKDCWASAIGETAQARHGIRGR